MATPHLISVPISPFCPACGWEFAQNQAVEGTVNKFCGSCGVDLTISQFVNSGGDVPANLLPGVVAGFASIPNTSVTFTTVANPAADTNEYRTRVNAGTWSAWTPVTGSEVVAGTTGDVVDIEMRSSVTGPPALVGASGPVAVAVVA